MSQGKSKGSILPLANDRNTRMIIWQNSHWLSHRMWNLHIRQQAYSHHHWSPHRMVRSFPNTRQVSRYHSIHIHQQLSSSPHVPQVHFIRQWHRIQESISGSSSAKLSIDCIFSAPNHTQSNGKLEVSLEKLKPTLKKSLRKGSSKLGHVHQSSSH